MSVKGRLIAVVMTSFSNTNDEWERRFDIYRDTDRNCGGNCVYVIDGVCRRDEFCEEGWVRYDDR